MAQPAAQNQIPYGLLAAATAAVVVFELVIPLAVLHTYDRFIPNQSLASLQIMFVVAVLCLAAEAVIRVARSTIMGFQGARFAHLAGSQLMENLLDGGLSGEMLDGPGRKLSLLNLIRGMRETGSGQRFTILADTAILPLSLLLIGMVAGWLVMVPIILISGFALFTWLAGQRLYRVKSDRQDKDTQRFDQLVGMLDGIQTIKALSVESALARRHDHYKERATRAHLKVSETQTFLFDASASFGLLLLFSVILVGAAMTVEGYITTGAMIAATILSGRSLPPIQKALGMLTRQQEYRAEAATLKLALSDDTAPPRIKPADCGDNAGAFSLSDVVLRDGDDPISFEFPLKQLTLLDIADDALHQRFFAVASGLRRPLEGQVLLNGAALGAMPDGLRSAQMGVLTPNSIIYRGSIMDNLSRYGSVPLSDVLFISKHMRLEEDLAILSRGFDTKLSGDGSDPVPPGLRHRIALARALVTRPKVILFDAADTGLDQRSFAALVDLLAKLRGRATVVMTSNDPSLRALAQNRVELGPDGLRSASVSRAAELSVARYRELRM